MYRDILSKPIDLKECVIEHKCSRCGRTVYLPEDCPMEHAAAAHGFSSTPVCKDCRGDLVEV